MTLKNHLLTTATLCVLMLGIAIAQDQAPAAPTNPRGRPALRAAAAAEPLNNAANGADAAALPAAADDDAAPPPRGPGALNNRPGQGATRPATAPAVRPATTLPGGRTPAMTTLPGLGASPDTGTATAATKAAAGAAPTNSLKFTEAPLDIVLGYYASLTKRTPIVWPDVPSVTITHKNNDDVEYTPEENIRIIELILSSKGIVIEFDGDKLFKVLNKPTARSTGVPPILETVPPEPHPENGKTISQMIGLLHITVAEAQKALEGLKRPDGLFQMFERTNSILVTDTQENINRMLQIVKIIDQPIPVEEDVVVRIIKYAKADDIKKRLEEFVAESQKQQGQPKEEIRLSTSGAPIPVRTPGTSTTTPAGRPPVPGLVRPPTTPAPITPLDSINAPIDDASRGMIKGKVHIMSDERSNQLIITTRPSNMTFFDQIIDVLDIETAPDVKVEVQRLKYADADEVATKLNDLIGNATAQKTGTANPAAPGATRSGPGTSAPGGSSDTSRGGALSDIADRIRTASPASANAPAGETKIGQLSKDNIKILSDKRTNAIIMMGSRNDLAALKQIIESMDIQLSQVLIETVVVQVELGSGLSTGIDWVLGKQANDYVMGGRDKTKMAGGGGSGTSLLTGLTGITTSSGSSSISGGSSSNEVLTAASHVLGQGINYFLQSDRLNVSALITAAKTDSRAKVLSSPILLTVDNKEASIEATSMRYLYKGVRYSGSYNYGNEVPDYEQRDIGLTVKVTPRINPNGTVVLTIDEKFETVGPDQDVGGQKYPTITTRKLTADVSVENMQTVVLGGLVQSESKKAEGGIPLLKDIPWIGRWLFGSVRDEENRSELLIFLTPYVFEDSASAMAEAQRRRSILSDPHPWDDGGWSLSPLADPVSAKTRLQRQGREWADADEEYKAARDILKANEERAKMLLERTNKEAKEREKKQGKSKPTDVTVRLWDFEVGGDSVQIFVPGEADEE